MRPADWLKRDMAGDTSGHECATRLWLAAAAKTALRSRRLLVVAGLMAAAVPGLTKNAMLFLAIPAAYFLRFAIALFDVSARQSALRMARRLPIELPAIMSFSDRGARRLVERLDCARRLTAITAQAGPVELGLDVSYLIERVPQLERDVVVLVARVEYLKRFLDSTTTMGRLANDAGIESEHSLSDGTIPAWESLERVSAGGPELFDRLAGLTDRMNKNREMAEEVLRTLEQIPAQIIDLQLTRIESCDGRSADACSEAATIRESFGARERAIPDLPFWALRANDAQNGCTLCWQRIQIERERE